VIGVSKSHDARTCPSGKLTVAISDGQRAVSPTLGMDWTGLRWHISRVFMSSLYLAAPGSDPGAASLLINVAAGAISHDSQSPSRARA